MKCTCGAEGEKLEAVKYNPYNNVVNCHRCGEQWVPSPGLCKICDGPCTQGNPDDLSRHAEFDEVIASTDLGKMLTDGA